MIAHGRGYRHSTRSRHVHTISEDDVGRPWIRIGARVWLVSDWIGSILPVDVGKRVFQVWSDSGTSTFLQVENDQQRTRRLARGAR